MRILLGYSCYKSPFMDVRNWVEAWLCRLRQSGIEVYPFCLTLDPPGPRLEWKKLKKLWKFGDRKLLNLYASLARELEDYDVFVNWNGINLIPDFVRQLPTFNVYGCFDDPEQSSQLSQPVATAYDLCMVGNLAEVETYRSWGVKHAFHWPLGFRLEQYNPHLTKENILQENREVDLSLICERVTAWRHQRLDRFVAAFPQGHYYGKGWPRGTLANEGVVPLFQKSKIGLNLHNSTGPINFRTFWLPANGVLQICDNKSHLGQLFALNTEVVGFDTIDEAIDLCHYYLAHEDQRRAIAAAGWERATRDYNEVSAFRRMTTKVEEITTASHRKTESRPIEILGRHRLKTTKRRTLFQLKAFRKQAKHFARRIF